MLANAQAKTNEARNMMPETLKHDEVAHGQVVGTTVINHDIGNEEVIDTLYELKMVCNGTTV